MNAGHLLRVVAAAVCSLCLVSPSVNAQNPRLANDAIERFLAAQNMVHIPTAWQPLIQPGSLIVVEWHKQKVLKYWVLDGTLPYRAAADRPVDPIAGPVMSGDSQAFRDRTIDFSAVLGPLAPGVALSNSATVNYPQTTFESASFGAGDIKDLVRKSPIMQQWLKDLTITVNGNINYPLGRQVFIVTQVFGVSDIDVQSTNNTALTLRSQASSKDADGCVKSTDTTPATTPTTTPASAATGTLKQNTDVQSAAGTAMSKALPIPPATLTLCDKGGGHFKLSRTPAVPLGMTVAEINYYNSQPTVEAATMKDVIQAMRPLFK